MPIVLDNVIIEGLVTAGSSQSGFEATTLSASTLSLTATSKRVQLLSGTTFGQVVQLPNATTVDLGRDFLLVNDSATFFELRDGNAGFLDFIFPYSSVIVVATNVASAAGDWVQSHSSFYAFNNPRVAVSGFDDFLGGAAASTHSLGWATATNGTGAGLTTPALATTSNLGVVSLNTGTNAAGRACIFLSNTALTFGGGPTIFDCYLRLPTLSDGTNTYKVYAGFGDVTAAGNMVDGVYFSYTNGEQAGNWATNTSNNSTRTQGDSGVAATTNFTRLRFVVNAGGTSARFLVGDTAAGEITTNIPTTTARSTGPLFKIEKTVGTTSRSLDIDYYSSTFFATTSRG